MSSVKLNDAGEYLAQKFQGWHIGNVASESRTVSAFIPFSSSLGSSIITYIQAMPNVQSADSEEVLLAKKTDPDNFNPVQIKIRGGSDYCATTVCDVQNYMIPSPEYMTAIEYVIKMINRDLILAKGGVGKGAANSFLERYKGRTLKYFSPNWFKPPYGGTIMDLVTVSKRIIDGSEPAWRDPRSRGEAESQFKFLLRQLIQAYPSPAIVEESFVLE